MQKALTAVTSDGGFNNCIIKTAMCVRCKQAAFKHSLESDSAFQKLIFVVQRVIDPAGKCLNANVPGGLNYLENHKVNIHSETSLRICPLSAATFNSAESYNRRGTLLWDRTYLWEEKRLGGRIESKLVRRYEYGTWCILRSLFTSAVGYFITPSFSFSPSLRYSTLYSLSPFPSQFPFLAVRSFSWLYAHSLDFA